MSEHDVPTRVDIQQMIDSSLTQEAVIESLADFPVAVRDKIISDLPSYEGWDNLVENQSSESESGS